MEQQSYLSMLQAFKAKIPFCLLHHCRAKGCWESAIFVAQIMLLEPHPFRKIMVGKAWLTLIYRLVDAFTWFT